MKRNYGKNLPLKKGLTDKSINYDGNKDQDIGVVQQPSGWIAEESGSTADGIISKIGNVKQSISLENGEQIYYGCY
jgi:hypothetical protein